MLNTYQLVMHAGPTPGKTYLIDQPEIIIGRDLRSNIVINDVEVSRSHCRVSTYENGIYIEDLNSTNGTFINGNRITKSTSIKSGDILKIGETVTMVMEKIAVEEEKTIASPQSPAYIPVAVQPQQSVAEPHITTTPPPNQAEYITPIPDPIYDEHTPMVKERSMPEEIAEDQFVMQQPEKSKISKGKAILITILFMLILLAIIVGAFLWYVDANYLWCDFFGFLINGCY
jgi:hypothetical protein